MEFPEPPAFQSSKRPERDVLLLLVFWETDEEDVWATKERDVLLVVCWATDEEDVGATKADDVDAEEATAARARAREVLLRLVVILLKNNAGLVHLYLRIFSRSRSRGCATFKMRPKGPRAPSLFELCGPATGTD